MKSCPNCQNSLLDEQFQCDRCGMVVSQPFCFSCRAPIENIEDRFCTHCGAPFSMPFGIPYFQMTAAGEAWEEAAQEPPAEETPEGLPEQPPAAPAWNTQAGFEEYQQSQLPEQPAEALQGPVPGEPAEPAQDADPGQAVEPAEESVPAYAPGLFPGTMPEPIQENPRTEPDNVPGYRPKTPGPATEDGPGYQPEMPGMIPESVPVYQPGIPGTAQEEIPAEHPEIRDAFPEEQPAVSGGEPSGKRSKRQRTAGAAETVSYRDYLSEEPAGEEPEKAPSGKKKRWIIIACCAVVLALAAAAVLLLTKPAADGKSGSETVLPFRTVTPEPSVAPTPESTAVPTPEATATPTVEPTTAPAPEATEVPTPEKTEVPTPEKTEAPTPEPTVDSTPTAAPAVEESGTAEPESDRETEENEDAGSPDEPEDAGEDEEADLPKDADEDVPQKETGPAGDSGPVTADSFPVLAKTTIKKVNVRSKPDQSGRRLQYINDPGTIVTLLGKRTDKAGNVWYQIRLSNGDKGYISAKYVIPEDRGEEGAESWTEELAAQENRFPFQAKTTKKKVILRFKPESRSRRVTYITRKGTTVTVLEATADKQGIHWYKVRLENGTTGYAQSEYFTQE